LEYGADVTLTNNRKKTIYELCIGGEFQQTLKSKEKSQEKYFVYWL